MIPKISRGDRMQGLLAYLVGPGRSNEHTEPHLVAGDPAVMAWHDDSELSAADAQSIARTLDQPHKALGVAVAGGHVWHCSLSLAADEGRLTDAQWAGVAQDFVEGMGFGDEQDAQGSGRAPTRWVAVHHGTSTGGNDHIHLAVSLVREDGTKASIGNDRPRAQRLAGELEAKYGLRVLESRQAGRGATGVTRAELERTERDGAAEPVRRGLERAVRAASTAAGDEAEFVRRLRADQVLVRPRLATGSADVIVGYSVAARPTPTQRTDGARPLWFGGGHLARDLALPRLRQAWPDTPQSATAAAAEWTAAKRGRRPVAPGRERHEPTAAQWSQLTDDVAQLRESLRAVPIDDRATWAQVSKDAAGAFAAWSRQVETTPGPLAATSAALARSATVRTTAAGRRPGGTPARGAAMLLASVAHGGRGTVAQAALLRQLMNTAKALHDAHAAAGEAQQAAEISAAVRGQLVKVRDGLPELEAVAPVAAAVAGRAPAPQTGRPVGAALPNKLPARAQVEQDNGPNSGR